MQTRTLEEQSFENLVNFYSKELKRLMKGERMEKVMPERTSRRPLYKYGVLYKPNPRTSGGCKIVVSDEAKAVLGVG